MVGLVGFILSSLLCSLAPSIFLLIILRAIQGFTAAMMLSVSLGLVKKSFPKSMLGQALGIYAVVIAGGLTLGPAIGGILDGLLGWRSIFLINLPMGILSLIICFKILDRENLKRLNGTLLGQFHNFWLFSHLFIY